MIDLHCHMLPGIDDGAPDLDTALEMARIAVADGIETTACTPHIYPGLYLNDAAGIANATVALRRALLDADIRLEISYGADIQMVPELLTELRAGRFPTLHGSRYFLFEPPHHTVPARFLDLIFDTLAAGYVPVITHPERLSWIDDEHYDWLRAAVRQGAWLQITAGALTGRFSPRAQALAERLLGDGLVHLIATDAHSVHRRPPLLAEGRQAAEAYVGAEEAERLVRWRPRAVIDDIDPDEVPVPPGVTALDSDRVPAERRRGWLSRLFTGP